MKRLGIGITVAAVIATSLPVAAAGWDAAAVGQNLSDGQPSRALEATRARLADHPDDPRARFLQAMALAYTGDVADAISGYAALSRQYPQHARVWNNLGVLYARQGRLDKARDALTHAVHADPNYATAHANLRDVNAALANESYRRAQQEGADAAARQAINQALSRWAKAWSDQNLPAYLSVYSDDYQPHGETTRAQWIRQQRVRVTQSKAVVVSVSDVQVTAESADRARAVFQQHYRRTGDDRDATRQMLFVREDGSWRIRRES